MSGETDLELLIQGMEPVLSDTLFVFAYVKNPDESDVIRCQPKGTFWESEGLTLIIEKDKAQEMSLEFLGEFHCITLNVHSSLEAVGLTAAVSGRLTEEGISANVVAAYFHDHIFVAKEDAQRALQALVNLSKGR